MFVVTVVTTVWGWSCGGPGVAGFWGVVAPEGLLELLEDDDADDELEIKRENVVICHYGAAYFSLALRKRIF